MKLTDHLDAAERDVVESRLRANLMAWFTTVDAVGQPTSVPVWFLLRDDETILIYSQDGKKKLHNLAANPRVAFGLDVTDIGRSNVRIEGHAHAVADVVPADMNPPYLANTPSGSAHCSARHRNSPRCSRCLSSSPLAGS